MDSTIEKNNVYTYHYRFVFPQLVFGSSAFFLKVYPSNMAVSTIDSGPMVLVNILSNQKVLLVSFCNRCYRIGDISRDVSRTFPSHVLFQSTGELGQLMLENVLRCVSEYFPNIGYCQV